MRRIVLASQKGGVCKTTTACALAIGLARRGHKTLLVDLDGQASATWTITRGRGAEKPTVGDVLLRNALADEAIRATETANLDLLPADASLNGANVALVGEIGRDTRLRSAMASVGDRWRFVILDTAPAFSPVLANALVFGDEVIVPVDCGVYSLLGLAELQGTIDEVRDAYGGSVRLAGVLITRVARSNVCRDMERQVRERFGPLVFKATIPASAKFDEAGSRGLTIGEHAPKSPGAVAYDNLILEIEHGDRTKDRGRVAGKRSPRKDHAA